MTATESAPVYVTVRCRPYTSFARGEYRCRVASDGDVLVYDSIAGHYTRCHILSARDLTAIRRAAEAKK